MLEPSNKANMRLDRTILYTSGYKHQLYETYAVMLPFRPPHLIETHFISFYEDGLLIIRKGYAWDGPSGPAFDTHNFMRGSLPHDVVYQLIRMGLLHKSYRKPADRFMYTCLREDKMWHLRAKWCVWGVRRFAARAADPKKRKKIHESPWTTNRPRS